MTIAKVANAVVTQARLQSSLRTGSELKDIESEISRRTSYTCLEVRFSNFELVLVNDLFLKFFDRAVEESKKVEVVSEGVLASLNATSLEAIGNSSEQSLRSLKAKVQAIVSQVHTAMNNLVQVSCHGFSASEIVLVDNIGKLDARIQDLEAKLIEDTIIAVEALGFESLNLMDLTVSGGSKPRLEALQDSRIGFEQAISQCAASLSTLAAKSKSSTIETIAGIVRVKFLAFFVIFEIVALSSSSVSVLIENFIQLLTDIAFFIDGSVRKAKSSEMITRVLGMTVNILDFIGNVIGKIPGASVNPAVKYTKLTLATISSLVTLANNALAYSIEQVELRQMRTQALTARADVLLSFTRATCEGTEDALGLVREEKRVLSEFVAMAAPVSGEPSAMTANLDPEAVRDILSIFCFRYATLCAQLLPQMRGQASVADAAIKLLPQVQRLSHVAPITDFAVALTDDEKERYRSFGFVDAFDSSRLRRVWEAEHDEEIQEIKRNGRTHLGMVERAWDASHDNPRLMVCRGCGDGVVFHAKLVKTAAEVEDAKGLFRQDSPQLRVCKTWKSPCPKKESKQIDLPFGSTLNFVRYSKSHFRVAFYKAPLSEVAKTDFGVMVALDQVILRRSFYAREGSENNKTINTWRTDCRRLLESQGGEVMAWTAERELVKREFVWAGLSKPRGHIYWEDQDGYVKFTALTGTFVKPSIEMKQHLERYPATTNWSAVLPDAVSQAFGFVNVFEGCGCELRFPSQYSTIDGVRVARLRSPRYNHLQDVRCGYANGVWLSSAALSGGTNFLDDGLTELRCRMKGESVALDGSFFSVDELVLKVAANGSAETLVGQISLNALGYEGAFETVTYGVHRRVAHDAGAVAAVPAVTPGEFGSAALLDPVISRMQDAVCEGRCSFQDDDAWSAASKALGVRKYGRSMQAMGPGSSKIRIADGRMFATCNVSNVHKEIWGAKKDWFDGKNLDKWSQVMGLMFKNTSADARMLSLAADAQIPDRLRQITKSMHSKDCDMHWTFVVSPPCPDAGVSPTGDKKMITFHCPRGPHEPIMSIMVRIKIGKKAGYLLGQPDDWTDADGWEDMLAAEAGFVPIGGLMYQTPYERSMVFDRWLSLKLWKMNEARIPKAREQVCS